MLGVNFISQPSNVTVGIGSNVHFNCTYTGTNANPLWNITNSNRESNLASTIRLPTNHIHSGSGLFVRNVDERQNMSSYSCLFQVYERDKVMILASEVGTLVVLETLTFRLEVTNYEPLSNGREYILYEGDNAPQVSVILTGYTNDIYSVPLLIKLLNEEYPSISLIKKVVL